MARATVSALVAVLALFLSHAAGDAINCHQLCDEVRNELKPGIACRNFRRQLPRPKIGNSCADGYQKGVTDSCFAMCAGETAEAVPSSACREYKAEMPKPLTFKACETGYKTAFGEAKTMVQQKVAEYGRQAPAEKAPEPPQRQQEKAPADPVQQQAAEPQAPAKEDVQAPENVPGSRLRGEATPEAAPEVEAPSTPDAEPVAEPEPATTAEAEAEPVKEEATEEKPAMEEGAAEVIATLPVTVDDTDIDLVIHKDENPTDAVAKFCAQHMQAAGDACIQQLLPHVERKLQENGLL